MADHRSARVARLRTIGRGGAVVAGGVLALSGIAAGTASADEGHDGYDETTTGTTAEDPGFIPTSPVDGIANHWMMNHYQEENFAADEVDRIVTDPQRYIDVHLGMVAEMLGQESGAGTLSSDY